MNEGPLGQIEPPQTTSAAKPQTFREIAKLFISDEDDARGRIALMLFLYEILDRDQQATNESICAEAEKLSSTSISTLYFAAANRLLETHFQALNEKRLDGEISKDRMYLLITADSKQNFENIANLVDNASSQISSDIKELSVTQTFQRQVTSSAVATVIVAIVALIIVFSPDIITALKGIKNLITG